MVLTLHRLAMRLRLPARWLDAEANAGRIPCLRVGKRKLFNLAAVELALSEMANGQSPDAGTGEVSNAK